MALHDPDDFLMGTAVPSAQFNVVGDYVEGIVKAKEMRQQKDIKDGTPKFWDDGAPQMMLVCTLATDLRDPTIDHDNGERKIYIRSNLHQAVVAAIKAQGAVKLEFGGRLKVIYIGDDVQEKKGFNKPKMYRCEYTPADVVALQSGGAQQVQAAPAAVQTAPPVQAAPPVAADRPVGITVDAAAAQAAIAAMTPEQRQAIGLPPF